MRNNWIVLGIVLVILVSLVLIAVKFLVKKKVPVPQVPEKPAISELEKPLTETEKEAEKIKVSREVQESLPEVSEIVDSLVEEIEKEDSILTKEEKDSSLFEQDTQELEQLEQLVDENQL